jgi:hypothetical protein
MLLLICGYLRSHAAYHYKVIRFVRYAMYIFMTIKSQIWASTLYLLLLYHILFICVAYSRDKMKRSDLWFIRK